jgi:CubicO group peptidase (beta-lactamase class C family)
MDPDRLELVRQRQEFLYGSESWGIVIIRRGYLVREFYTFNVLIPTRFDIWSCTKTFTGTAWGLLVEDSRQGRLPGDRRVELDSLAYDHIPEDILSRTRRRRASGSVTC